MPSQPHPRSPSPIPSNWAPSVHENPYPNSQKDSTQELAAAVVDDAGSSSPAGSPKDPSMDFHYPHGPRRATWAGEPSVPMMASTVPPMYPSLHFQPSALPPDLAAAETLSGLASTFLPDAATVFHHHDIRPAASASSILNRRSPPHLVLGRAASDSAAASSSQSPPPDSPTSAYRYESFSQIPRLPPILQVERTRVTTTATQAASAQRRRNDATFKCPVPECGSTFTRRFNLRGHLRSHTEEKPYICSWPDCAKGFARQHDCKRHQALHTSKSAHLCPACEKSFSRMDALNRHLRSSTTCRQKAGKATPPPVPSRSTSTNSANVATSSASRPPSAGSTPSDSAEKSDSATTPPTDVLSP